MLKEKKMNLKEAKKFIKEFIEEAKGNFEVKQGSEQVTNIFEKDTESKGLKTEFSGMSFFIDEEKIAVYSTKFKKNQKGEFEKSQIDLLPSLEEINLSDAYKYDNLIFASFVKKVLLSAIEEAKFNSELGEIIVAAELDKRIGHIVENFKEMEKEKFKELQEKFDDYAYSFRKFNTEPFMRISRHFKNLKIPFITDKIEKYNNFISYIEQINIFFKNDNSIDLATENILKNFLEKYNISFENDDSVLLHQFLRVNVGIFIQYWELIKDCRSAEEEAFNILMLLFRNGRWNDYMENRRFYSSVFNLLEKETDKQHTVSEISERIDKEKFNNFEQNFKKIFGTLPEIIKY
jgi:hypothetical protein